ncbi:MAG: sulfurtransferase TusA family protein [Candidatus Ranarchaeia archaeon]
MEKNEKPTLPEHDFKLDLVGYYCPEPIYKTRIKMDQLEKGEVLEVRADDPGSEEDLKVLCKNMGYTLLNIRKEDDVIIFLMKK